MTPKGGDGGRLGRVMVVDMAGLERTKKSGVYGAGMRESSNINASIMR